MVGTTIHGSDVWHMVAQKGTPALTARAAVYLGHVFGDGRLSHREAELEQFAMNARRAPKHILNTHPSDQRPQTGIDARPALRRRSSRNWRKDRAATPGLSELDSL